MRYRLVYISTRNFDGSLVPVDMFEPIPLDHVTDDYNEADRMRCELCSVMNFGYVCIIEEDVHTSDDHVKIVEEEA